MAYKTYEESVNAYKKYIDDHIENVLKAFEFYGNELCERLGLDHDRLAFMIHDHDKSKYEIEEFDGYRCYFYPTEDEENDVENKGYTKKKFDAAWLHHLRSNAHHPEFWITVDSDNKPVAEVMPRYYVAEMLLDWAAMGIVKGDTAYSYYTGNIGFKPFHRDTMNIIDSCIDIFKDPIN